MKPVAILLCMAFALVMGMSPAIQGADEVTEAKAGELFRQAFETHLPLRDRVEALKEVAADYDETRWADDALWALAELSASYRLAGYATKYRQELIAAYPAAELEPLSREQALYRNSPLPNVVMALELTGCGYFQRGDRLVEFNALPMVTYYQLALAYRRESRAEPALEHFRAALATAPPRSLFRSVFQRAIADLELRMRAENTEHTPKQQTAPAREGAGNETAEGGPRSRAAAPDNEEPLKEPHEGGRHGEEAD